MTLAAVSSFAIDIFFFFFKDFAFWLNSRFVSV